MLEMRHQQKTGGKLMVLAPIVRRSDLGVGSMWMIPLYTSYVNIVKDVTFIQE
jgi:hypothetical protein